MTEIATVGYPRSGNTWLCRILSEMLYAPMLNVKGDKFDKRFAPRIKDDYVIRKTHWSFREAAVNRKLPSTGEHRVFVYLWRDPRDICVSQMYYYNLQNLGEAIGRMVNDNYIGYHWEWVEGRHTASWRVSFEELVEIPVRVLQNGLYLMTGEHLDSDRAKYLAERHKFENWLHLDRRQNRKGIVGDWKNHFTRPNAKVFEAHFGEILESRGYTRSRDWWQEVPRKLEDENE